MFPQQSKPGQNHSNSQNDSDRVDLLELTEQQLGIVKSTHPIIQVIAAAGSGKTRTIIEYIRHNLECRAASRFKVLLLSFSRKAVFELSSRLGNRYKQNVEISTFHSYCYRRLIQNKSGREPCFKLITSSQKMEFIRDFVRKHPHETGGIPFAFFEKEQSLRRYNPELADTLKAAYQLFKKDNGLLDFEDLVLYVLEELSQNSALSRLWREEFDMVVVDEFQDTDPLQLEFLQSLNPARLLVVGDDYQAIYGFRGATVQPFLQFKKFFPAANVIRLTQNFRSVKQLVRFGNKVIKRSSHQLKKRVRGVRENFDKYHAFSYALSKELRPAMAALINLAKSESMLLVRTNFVRMQWIRSGLDPDKVMTIHKSKGLEFQNVLLDVCEGWSSAMNSIADAEKMDEEIRLHYVGVSRARDKVVVFHSIDEKKRSLENRYFQNLYKKVTRKTNFKNISKLL